MIVCLCRGISDRTIKKTIDHGAKSVAAVGRACGAGTDCGSCQRHIAALVEQRREAAAAEEESTPAAWNLPVLQTG